MPTEPPDLEPPSHDLPSIELPVSTTTTATTNRAFLRQKSLVRAATMISRFETKKMEQPLMLLWVPGGFCLGIIFTYLSFGVIPLEDPTIPENSWWQCMFTCATMWYGLYSALTVYVFHTNVIRRHELAILGLKWRFLSAYLVGSVLLAAVWSLMAEPWKTDRVHFPFIGVIGAICGVLLGNVAISLVVPLRLHYKELRKGIIWTSIFNALGMVGSIAIYWGVLETIISVKNAVPDTLWWLPAASAGPLYYVAKVLSKATLRRMLYESHNRDYDSTYAPVLSWWMAVLHSSFMCVTVGLSAWLAAIVIIAIDGVLLLRSMRALSKRKQGAAVHPYADPAIEVGGGTTTAASTWTLGHKWGSSKAQDIPDAAKKYFDNNNIRYERVPATFPEGLDDKNKDVTELNVGSTTGKTFKLKGKYVGQATKPAVNVGNDMECKFVASAFTSVQRRCDAGGKCKTKVGGLECKNDFCVPDGSAAPANTTKAATTAPGGVTTTKTATTATTKAATTAPGGGSRSACPSSHPYALEWNGSGIYWCYETSDKDSEVCRYTGTLPAPAGGTWGTNQTPCPQATSTTAASTTAASTTAASTTAASTTAASTTAASTTSASTASASTTSTVAAGRRQLAVGDGTCNLRYSAGHYVSYDGTEEVGDARYTIKVSQAYKTFNIIAKQETGGAFAPVSLKCIGGDRPVDVSRGSDTKVNGEKLLADYLAGATLLTWVLRFVTFIMVWCGLQMCCGPCALMPDIIPFIGPFIGDLVGMLLCCATCLLGFCCWVLVFAVAWVRFRPMVGIPLLVCGLLAGGGVIAWRVKAKMDEDNKKGDSHVQMS